MSRTPPLDDGLQLELELVEVEPDPMPEIIIQYQILNQKLDDLLQRRKLKKAKRNGTR